MSPQYGGRSVRSIVFRPLLEARDIPTARLECCLMVLRDSRRCL